MTGAGRTAGAAIGSGMSVGRRRRTAMWVDLLGASRCSRHASNAQFIATGHSLGCLRGGGVPLLCVAGKPRGYGTCRPTHAMSTGRNTFGYRLVNRCKWLDPFANVFGAVMTGLWKVPGTRPLKSLLHGTWPLGHPL